MLHSKSVVSRVRLELQGVVAMSGTDSKPRFGGNTNKSRFGGGTAIKYGGGSKKNQTTDKGPTPGLEDVFLSSTNQTPK